MGKIVYILLIAFMNLALVSAEINDTNYTASLASAASLINLTRIIPDSFSLGDSQLNIEVQNIGNKTISDITAFVTGRGFSTYEIIPIDSLEAGDMSYILVFGNFKEAGNVSLTINTNNQIFYEEVFVNSPASEEQEKIKEENAQILADVSSQLEGLKNNFSELESQIASKKDNNFDVSQVNAADLRSYIRSTESSVLSGNANSAKVNIRLALDEYVYQKNKLDNAKEVSTIDRLRNNALIFSALAGAFIMIFTLYELLKNKSAHVVSAIGSVRSKIVNKKELGRKNKNNAN